MKKFILVAIAIASLPSTTLADSRVAGHRTIVMGPTASPAVLNANASINGNVTAGDREMHIRNLRDSGYDPKNDFDAAGNISTAQ